MNEAPWTSLEARRGSHPLEVPISDLSILDLWFLRPCALVSKLRSEAPSSTSDDADAVYVAFNLHGDDNPKAAAEKLEEELVLGLYDTKAHTIYYRGSARTSEEGVRKQRLVIAHEVHHALQFSAFGPPSIPKHLDGSLAVQAVYEGDAQVTMAAFLGSEYGIPLNRTLRTIFDIHDRIDSHEVAHEAASSHSLAVTKRLLLFPYDEGMRFVSDIHRAGGIALVNGLYQHPPTATEHILHPDKYLAGELPTPVDVPTAPTGYRIVDHDRLGEFGMSQVLARCIGDAKAAKASVGWAGDHYAVAVDGEQRVALLWSTVWDDETHAERFAKLLESRRECWVGRKVTKWRIPDELLVQRDGRRVALVSGIGAPSAEEVALSLIALVGETPPPQEISASRVPETEPIPKGSRGTLRDDRYQSEWLGVKATIPSGMHATVSDEAELAIKRSGRAYGALFVSDRVHTEAYNEASFRAIHESAVEGASLDDLDLVMLSDHTATTPLGKGVARLWGARGSAFRLRVIMVPVCYGTGSYVFVQAYGNDQAQGVLDGWLDTFRWDSLDPPPICQKLNPQ